VSNDLKVRVEPSNSKMKNICYVSVTFITPENAKYTFVPSSSKLNLKSGISVTSRDFTLFKIYSDDRINSDDFLTSAIKLNGFVDKGWRYDGLTLYFNMSCPKVDDSFSLDINGLERDGKPIVIPQIQFSKGIR
jgi:hypothetical protein